MSTADQVVSVSAATWPSILWGHHQPPMDAEYSLICSSVHGTNREDEHTDQTAQYQPWAHSLHINPSGCGSVMELHSGPDWTTLTQETITDVIDWKPRGVQPGCSPGVSQVWRTTLRRCGCHEKKGFNLPGYGHHLAIHPPHPRHLMISGGDTC